MNRFFSRLIVLLLIPCLIQEPVFALFQNQKSETRILGGELTSKKLELEAAGGTLKREQRTRTPRPEGWG